MLRIGLVFFLPSIGLRYQKKNDDQAEGERERERLRKPAGGMFCHLCIVHPKAESMM